MKSFNRDERAKVLSFATGTSRVPLGGFVELQGVQGVQRFSIHKAYGDPDRLPQAHTCTFLTDNCVDRTRLYANIDYVQASTKLTSRSTPRTKNSGSSC